MESFIKLINCVFCRSSDNFSILSFKDLIFLKWDAVISVSLIEIAPHTTDILIHDDLCTAGAEL